MLPFVSNLFADDQDYHWLKLKNIRRMGGFKCRKPKKIHDGVETMLKILGRLQVFYAKKNKLIVTNN